MTAPQNLAADAAERLAEIEATTNYNVDIIDPVTAWIDGYTEGHRAARDELGADHPDANSDPR